MISPNLIENTPSEILILKNSLERISSDYPLNDKEIYHILESINQSSEKDKILDNLFDKLCELNYNENTDWNIGNLLEKVTTNDITTKFKKLKNKFYLYNSAGLAWAIGEHNEKNIELIDFLQNTIKKTKNSDAWWQAAFALEKICDEDAINLLKHSIKEDGLKPLEYYLKNLDDKKSIIGIISHANSKNIQKTIYPKIKNIILKTKIKKALVNSIWLVGRLQLIDFSTEDKLIKLFEQTHDYEMIHTILFALSENNLPKNPETLNKHLHSENPKIRKLCIKCLSNIDSPEILLNLEKLLFNETDPEVIGEISQSIYRIKNHFEKEKNNLRKKCCENENGLIIDETDKWYEDPEIYNKFSEAEDPEDLCFRLILQKIDFEKVEIINPIDIATGTGKIIKKIIQDVNYIGIAYATDINQKMLNYLKKSIIRKKAFTKQTKLIKSPTANIPLENKSTCIISSFGFPSKISNPQTCINELKKIYSMLKEEGVFITIGWDESFNDELNEMWFKYLPDKINASNFEEWRIKRKEIIKSPRNCNLTWFKKGLKIPLQFNTIYESAAVMGHLFGKDALKDILKNKKTSWIMSLGITYNTKKEIENILRNYNERDRSFNGVA